MQTLPSLYRVFHFVCDDLPYSIAVDHSPDIAGEEQESYLTGRFHSMLDAVLPGRRAAGQVTGITFLDDIHPVLPSSANHEPGAPWRASEGWQPAVCQ